MTKTAKTILELHSFVIEQAREDAVLPLSERRYQAQLVNDVLKQEAPDAKSLKTLLNDYTKQLALCRS